MDLLFEITATLVAQLQKPTLAFLIGGMVRAAMGSKLEVPAPVYKFIVLVLLLKVGLGAGISVREADLIALAVPAIAVALVGVAIMLLGSRTLARTRGVSRMDGMATAGLFGAVSASTLAAGMVMLDAEGIACAGFIGALYPFMDIATLVTAILFARMGAARAAVAMPAGGGVATVRMGGANGDGIMREILTDTLKSPAISSLLLGLAIRLLGRPEQVYASFYEPLFRGLLSILMLIMGMEVWARLGEMRKVAHAYVFYGIAGPLAHGALGFGAGLAAHYLTGFSAGAVVLLAVMAASSSDILGPPTLRAALPEANPSAYVGTSTGIGTPVAILSIPLWIALADWVIGI